MKQEDISAYECKFAVYCRAKDYNSDIHFIKEVIHYKDGTSKPNVRLIKNFKRDFYVSKKGRRNYKSKKEWVDLEEVDLFTSTQTELTNSVAKALGQPWSRKSLRDLSKSPYLYGSDILSTCIIKQSYKDKWDKFTPYTNAVFDTETDVVNGTEQIIMATVSFKDKVITAIQKSFVSGYVDAQDRIEKLADKYIGDTIEKRGIKLEIKIVDSEIDVVRTCIEKAHEWSPDFLSVWNLDFDMTKIIKACERAGVEIEDLLSDPIVPKEYRSFKYKKGTNKKISSSGKVTVLSPSEQWHSVLVPSSFYWIDAMAAYRQVRNTLPAEPSYSLDVILNKNLNIGKLKFDKTNQYVGLQWHQVMQSKHPLEYVVYNIFDCVSMEMLDEKTLDLQLSLPMISNSSDFQNFNSQPRRAANALHFYALENKKVIASTSSDMKDDDDDKVTGLSGWIVMLAQCLVADNGLKLLKEASNVRTNIRAFVGD